MCKDSTSITSPAKDKKDPAKDQSGNGGASFSGKLLKNYFYNGSYKLLLIIIPILTTPYLARVLGKDKLGIDGYVLSVVTLVELFGALGINLYANREVAYVRDNKQKLTNLYYELQYIRLFLCGIVLAGFVGFSFFSQYKIFFLIHSLSLVGYFLDVTWLFIGLEEMKSPVIRNVIIKLLQTALVFILIRSRGDLYKYVLITASCTFVSSLCMYPYVGRYIGKVQKKQLNIKRHIKPVLLLFLPQAASSLYVQFDRTMIGLLASNISYVSIYDKAETIVKVPLQLTAATTAVMLPRISNEFVKGRIENIKQLVMKEIRYIFLFLIPMAFGLISIANHLTVWYLGSEYTESVSVVMLLTPTILTIGMGEVLGSQLMISFNKTKEMTLAFGLGAISNIILNSILIPRFNADGAAIATVIAEAMVLVIQWKTTREYIYTSKILASFIKKLIASLAMFAAIEQMDRMWHGGHVIFVIQIAAGGVIYLVLLLLMRDNELMEGIRLVSKKLRRRK